jgi:Uncharacterised nucleotidyltransferase
VDERGALDLLCRCLAEADDPELAAVLSGPDVPWGRLLDLANVTRVSPALHWRLAERGLLAHIAAPAGEYLAGVAELAELRNDKHIGQLLTAGRVLNAVGIRPLPLKGAAALVTGLYPAVGARYMADVDLLVAPSRYGDALAALEADGYRVSPIARQGPAPRPGARHHPPLVRGLAGPPLELHRRVTDPPFDAVLDPEEVISAASPLSWRGVDLLIPSPLHRMLHLVVHSWMEWTMARALPRHPLLLASIEFGRLAPHLSEADWSAIIERVGRIGRRGSFARYVVVMRRLGRHTLPAAVRPGAAARALAPLVGGLWPAPGRLPWLRRTAAAILPRLPSDARTARRLLDHRRWRRFWLEVVRSGS